MVRDKPARVLIVEDEATVNQQICTQITCLGHTVVGSAYDAPEAAQLTGQLRPDVVLMDLQMPDPDTGHNDQTAGLRATQTIMACCPAAVILLTAYESAELIRQASEAGVGAYLIKPVRDNDLERAIAIARARFDDIVTLRRYAQELKARNDDLDAFAQTVAHDLKSPLGLLTGYAEVLETHYATMSAKERAMSHAEITRSVHKMNNIIEELLLVAELRQAEVELQPLDMAGIVAEVQRRLEHIIQDSQAEIVMPPAWPLVLGRAAWVQEVWINYLSNALKYGGHPPRVELGATWPPPDDVLLVSSISAARSELDRPALYEEDSKKDQSAYVCFWVQDNGPGIPPEHQSRLFKPFTRMTQARAKGHGLGLSIVQRIVEKLGGRVGVKSQVGQGSMFTFTLPAAVRPPAKPKA